MTQPGSTSELDHVLGEIRAEISLLNSRLNALISSQSFFADRLWIIA